MSLSPADRAIWSAMGLGPVWQARSAQGTAGALADVIVWLGDFDTDFSSDGRAWPIGSAGELLLNMVRAAGFVPEEQVFAGVRDLSPVALQQCLQQAGCARAVVLGGGLSDNAAGGLPGVTVLCMDSLSDLISQPMNKARAWAALCLIRDRFAPQR